MTEHKLREIIRKEIDAIAEHTKVVIPAVELEITEHTDEPIDNYRTDEENSKITEELNINEGQFSWYTIDTQRQIGSERENTILVYMYDNKGNKFAEKKYEGYGVFGKMDYFILLADMNGYNSDNADEAVSNHNLTVYGKKDADEMLRTIGISLAHGQNKIKSLSNKKVLFPALVEDPKFNYKRHDFTKEPDSDPNQSWFQEEEDEDFDY